MKINKSLEKKLFHHLRRSYTLWKVIPKEVSKSTVNKASISGENMQSPKGIILNGKSTCFDM